MAPASKGKTQGDHVKSFNVLVAEYQIKPSEKLLSEMDKLLAILAKITDISVFDHEQTEGFSLLLNCMQLLGTLESKSHTTWSIVTLLAHLAAASTSLASFLGSKLAVLPTLARLLHSGPTNIRTAKLLDLLLHIAAEVTIIRREAFLTSLLEQIASFVLDPSSNLTTTALQTLCHLTRDSYIVAKTLLVFLPLDKLTTTQFTSTTDQVSAEYLCLCLKRVQLSAFIPNEDKVKSFLRKITDVFCSCIAKDDGLPTLRLVTTFLGDMRNLPQYRDILSTQDATPQLQQVLTVKDFSDNYNPATADTLFQFLTEIVSLYQAELVSLFDHVVKLVLLRLEAKPMVGKSTDRVASSLGLVRAVVEETDLVSLSAPEHGILKFQVEQLLPSLLALLLDCRPAKDSTVTQESLVTVLSCMELLQMLAGLQEWSELVSQLIQSSKLTAAYRSLMAGLTMEIDRARLATEFITLATLLQGEAKWKKVREEVTGEPGTMALVSVILRKEGEEETRVRKALSILKAADYSMMEERQKNSKTEIEQMEVNMSAEQVLRIDQMLDTVSACLANTSLEPVLGEVVELAVARRGVERQEVESLKTALVGADATVQALTGALAAKEQQGRLLEGQVVRLVARLAAAKEELGDIRGQHGHLAKEADHTRDKLGKELADKMAEIEQMEEEKKELVAQLAKYKDVITEQNLSLKQLEENEKVLTGQLKKEMKLKEEKEMNLRKREEKLKKTEKKLDEELSTREKVERENEDLKKQCAQLQTLSKSQEQALAKKEKQLQENVEEIKDLRKLQETIFNLSKTRSGSNGSAAC